MTEQVTYDVEEEPPGRSAYGKSSKPRSLPQNFINQIVSGKGNVAVSVTLFSDTFVETNSLGLSGANSHFYVRENIASSNLEVFPSYDLAGSVNSKTKNLLLEVSHRET